MEGTDAVLGALADRFPFLVLVVVVIWLSLPQLAERYAIVAKIVGPLARRWKRKADKRAADVEDRHKAEVRKEAKVLAQEMIGQVAAAPDYAEMERRLERMDSAQKRAEDRIKRLEQSDEIQRAYIAYDADWHFDDEMAAVGKPDCEPADRLPFERFKALYREGWRPGQPVTS
jgi:hypothetical protein